MNTGHGGTGIGMSKSRPITKLQSVVFSIMNAARGVALLLLLLPQLLFKYVTVIVDPPGRSSMFGQNSGGGGSKTGGSGASQSYIGGGRGGNVQSSIKSKSTLHGEARIQSLLNNLSVHCSKEDEELLIKY